jgi:DNA-binding NarL/FixJ family response regulator
MTGPKVSIENGIASSLDPAMSAFVAQHKTMGRRSKGRSLRARAVTGWFSTPHVCRSKHLRKKIPMELQAAGDFDDTLPMSERIRLFVVEDQPKILKNQLKLLEAFRDIDIVGTALSGEEALEELEKLQSPPDVILCDLGLPQMSGIDVTREVKRRMPSVEILIFTIFDEEDKVVEAIKAGAAGYLLKGAEAEKIVEGIKEVRQGGSVIQPSLARSLLRHFRMPEQGRPAEPGALKSEEEAQKERESGAPPLPPGRRALSERELECLQIIAKGLSNNEAARVLGLSKATIRTHLEHIYQKLDVTNRVEAVTEGIRQGIIDL